MNTHLIIAMKELAEVGAIEAPTADQVDQAADGATWTGKLSKGGDWKLIKNNLDSYTTNTRKM